MTKYILKLDGMMCSMCEAHINDTIRKATNNNVKKLKSDHFKNTATFVTNDDINIDDVVNAIKAQGYNVLDIKSEEYLKESIFKKIFHK